MRATHSRTIAFVAPATVAAIVLAFATPFVGCGSAMAAAADPPTCKQLEERCVAFIHIRDAKAKPPADGVERPHIKLDECYDNYHKAEQTGVWPAHLPFNFAVKCTK